MMNSKEKRNMKNWRVWGGALALTLAAPMALAQAVIQSITSSQQAGADVVRIEMSEALKAVPAGFTIQQPARIAIDLPGVGNAMGKPSVEINQGNLRSVNVAQAGDRTRLVLNLKQASTYRAQIDGKALLIVVDSAAPAAAAVAAAAPGTAPAAATAAEPTTFAPSQNRDPQSLREIDFRRGVDGAGRVIVTLPSNQVGVDIRQQGTGLLVEFPRSTVPDSLRKRFDVTDFGTPVQTVTTTQSGDRVRMVIEPRGNWEHSAYQSDTQFVVEVRPVKVDPNKLTQGPGYQGEKLSLNFQNIEVRSLLQVIADFTNFNVVTSDTVTGSLTLRLKDVPWDQALDIILQAKGLGLRKSGNVIWIAPKDELAIKEQADLEAGKKKSELEPLRTQSFQLNYTKAEDVAKGLAGTNTAAAGGGAGGTSTKLLSARGSVISDQRTNQLFVTDIPSKLEEIQSLIARIDIPVRQVLIEARIVEASDTFGKSLGAKLGFNDMRGIRGGVPGWGIGNNNRVVVGGNITDVGQTTLQTPDAGDGYTNSQMVVLPAIGRNGYNPASFALSIFGAASNRFLNLEISALEADGKGKVVSSPRIITADQVKAFISQGTKIPFQRSTSSGATAIEFIEAALKLEVTPQITPEGNIIMDVKINKDSLGALTALGREINIKEVKTQVLVENGGTVVIGGIYEQDAKETTTKVPFLGDVPVLGNLFKTKTSESQRTELLVFLTPKVVTEKAAVR
jgi:type IV pilus assembly protein PilQ